MNGDRWRCGTSTLPSNGGAHAIAIALTAFPLTSRRSFAPYTHRCDERRASIPPLQMGDINSVALCALWRSLTADCIALTTRPNDCQWMIFELNSNAVRRR